MAEEQPLPLTELFPKGKKSTPAAETASPPAEPAAPETVAPPAADNPGGDADEPKKRRGRPPGGNPRKGKAGEEVLFLVETEPESGQYAAEEIPTTLQLLDILDSGRQIIATRSWRQF